MKKVGVIGSGYWGKNLVRNFHALGCLGAICDKDPEVLAQFKEKYPDMPCVLKYEQLLNGDEYRVDGIAVATPAVNHYELTKKAILAGKHVFVEKPLALKESEGLELVELAEHNRKTLMVGHILQYHSAILKLKELTDSGELGKIQYIYSNRLNIGKIRSEENILWSFAPHDISVMLMLLDEFPSSVISCGGNYVQQYVADVTMTTLEFPSGVKGHIFVSWLHPFKEQKLVVVGDRKMAVFDDVSDEKLFLYPHCIEWHCRRPVAVKANPEIVPVQDVEPLRAECQHFVDCISNDHQPRTDGLEGLRVLKVLNGCEASLRAGGVIVNLNSGSSLAKQDYHFKDIEPHAPHSEHKHGSPNSYFVHGSSYIDKNVAIGEGTKIWHFSHILENTKIGEYCNIGQNVVIGPDVSIGARCKIQNNVSVYKGVTLEDEVFCGPSMVFTNVYNPRSAIRRMDEMRSTLVKRGASIGANATIVCGVTIGRYAFVGAGAVVLKDVPDYALVVGNPGKQKGWMCECGVRLNGKLACGECGSRYRYQNGETDAIIPLESEAEPARQSAE
jgi:UDP-2-acetamido-3-amino-2,3-dideoxy-glucuronate N-acetyltransferase